MTDAVASSSRRRRQVWAYAGLAAIAGAGHVGYPAALWWRTRGKPDPPPPAADAPWPSVTILIAAYREVAVMPRKLRECLAEDYPGKLEVLVVADDAPTATAARQGGARVLESPDRRGKSAALTVGLAAAKGDVVVLTDANTALEPGSVAKLARWFADPTVGGVAGEKRHSHGREGAYWAFESWLKRREHRLGSTIGLVGECAAVRRSTTSPIPAWAVVDDLWLAISIIESGLRIVYEPFAVAIETPAAGTEEWERRTRIVAGAIQLLWRRRQALGPAQPLLAFELWGHRLWRMTLGPIANLALIAVATRQAFSTKPGATLARVVVAGHLAAGAALLAGEKAPAAGRAAGQALYLQVVGLGGMLRLAHGNVAAAWPKSERVTAS